MTNARHYLIYGAGAIGSLIGGLLAAGGQRVTFLDRPVVAGHLRQHGITVTQGQHRASIPNPSIVTTPEAGLAAKPDAIVFAVKSYHTAQAIAELHMAGGGKPLIPPILCFQNGVDNETALAAAFGADKVIAGTVTTAVSITAPGQITIEKPRGLGISTAHPLSAPIAADLQQAGLRVELYANPAAMKWSKLLTNLIANPTSAICDLPAGAVFAHDGLYRIEIKALRETLAVMNALELPVVKLPGVPVTLLARALRRLPPWLYRPYFTQKVAKGRGDKMPSFHVDLSRASKHSEVRWLNGAVARHGARAGVPTPVNSALTGILEAIVADPGHWNDYRHQPDKLVAAVDAQ